MSTSPPQVQLAQHEPPRSAPAEQAWTADQLWKSSAWRMALPPAVLDELASLSAGETVDEAWLERWQPDRPTPAIAALAAEIAHETLEGSGVLWLRGPELHQRFTPAEWKLLYLALGCAIGVPMEHYGRLYEVKDLGSSYKEKAIPVSQTRSATGFHTDSTARERLPDVVGLLCIQPGQEGGESLICSAAAAHEELRADRPELLRALYQEFVRDIVTPGYERGEGPLLENRFPVFSQGLFGRGLTLRYMRYWIEKGHQRAGLTIRPDRMEALDRLDRALCSERLAVRFGMEKGDMLWLNNHTIAHNRTAYTESSEAPRTMIRLWLEVGRETDSAGS